MPYYGRGGLSPSGEFIDNAPTNRAIVASIESNFEGRNLQHWSRALIVSPPQNGGRWEQILGRLHRDGQEAHEVLFEVLVTCIEHYHAIWRSLRDATYTEDTQGVPQKLLQADMNMPTVTELVHRGMQGARWHQSL